MSEKRGKYKPKQKHIEKLSEYFKKVLKEDNKDGK